MLSLEGRWRGVHWFPPQPFFSTHSFDPCQVCEWWEEIWILHRHSSHTWMREVFGGSCQDRRLAFQPLPICLLVIEGHLVLLPFADSNIEWRLLILHLFLIFCCRPLTGGLLSLHLCSCGHTRTCEKK